MGHDGGLRQCATVPPPAAGPRRGSWAGLGWTTTGASALDPAADWTRACGARGSAAPPIELPGPPSGALQPARPGQQTAGHPCSGDPSRPAWTGDMGGSSPAGHCWGSRWGGPCASACACSSVSVISRLLAPARPQQRTRRCALGDERLLVVVARAQAPFGATRFVVTSRQASEA